MKIKTANIRIFEGGKTRLEPINVKECVWCNNELFVIHKSYSGSGWSVSHYETGLSVGVKNAKTVAAAKQKFNGIMETTAHILQKTVKAKLNEFGAANELSEGGR